MECVMEQLPNSVAKYNDLKVLCTKNIIPKEYHSFFLSLKHETLKRNCLDQPDVDDGEFEE